MKLKCKIKTKYRFKRLEQVEKQLPNTIRSGVENALKGTSEYALHLLGTGNDGILFELVNTETNEIKGRVYTDQSKMPWSWFREFGTRNICSATTYWNHKAFCRKWI